MIHKQTPFVDRLVTHLKTRGVDLPAEGAELCVPFSVRRWRSPRVVWLNHAWFEREGLGPLAERDIVQLNAWLLENYAVTAAGGLEPVENLAGALPATMWADRYGEAWGAVHGGSGRSGCLRHGLTAKGIGRTPLVAADVDWYHSHGCLWLEEGLREAVCSEVVARTFPHGAVPVVAVIDTGDRIHWGDGNLGERRAVLVRPTVWRLGHLFRSIYFGTSGFAGSDQFRDELRVRDAVRSISAQDRQQAERRLDEFAWRIGEQLGFAAASRLWPGPVHSSNLTLSGAIQDFGSFRSLPDWRNHKATPREPGSRDDLAQLQMILERLRISVGKRLGGAALAQDLAASATRGFDQGFEGFFRESLQPPLGLPNWTRVIDHLKRAHRSPKAPSPHDDGFPLGAQLEHAIGVTCDGLRPSLETLAADGLRRGGEHWLRAATSRLRWRPSLVRETLLDAAQKQIANEPAETWALWIEGQIEAALRASDPDRVPKII